MLMDAMDGNQNFKAVKDVLNYLQGAGRKISQSQLYKDLKQGALRRQKDGTFRLRDVDNYASALPALSLPDGVQDEMGELTRRELEEKVAKTRAQRMAIEFDSDIKRGRYILREDVSLELASRAGTLDMTLRSTFRLYAADYIRLVGGDVDKAEELVAEFEKNLDAALTEFSRPMDFTTEYQGNNEQESEKTADEPEQGDTE